MVENKKVKSIVAKQAANKMASKDKMKIAIETYLNIFPYATNLQITQFLEKSTLGFPTGVTSQIVGAICKEHSKIDFKVKASVKYYFIE